MSKVLILASSLIALALIPKPAKSATQEISPVITNPAWIFHGTIVKVVDGDTLSVNIDSWPKPYNPVEVRVYGIDTPETHMPPGKCIKELKLGFTAKVWAKNKLPIGTKVTISWIGKHEKYGRLLATVRDSTGWDLGVEQVKAGNARPYFGAKKSDWCTP